MRTRLYILLTITIFMIKSSISIDSSSNWPMIDHDPQNSRSTFSSLPDEPSLLWEYNVKSSPLELSKTIESEPAISPIIYNDKIVFAGWKNSLFALDSVSGRVLWSYFHDKPAYAHWSGYIDEITGIVNYGEFVIATFLNGDLIIFNEKNGEIISNNNFGDSIEASIIDNGTIYVIADTVSDLYYRSLYSIDIKSGGLNWKYGEEIEGWWPALSEKKIYVFDSGNFYVLDKKNGNVILSKSFEQSWVDSKGRIIYRDNRLYVKITRDTLYCLDTENGNILWTLNTKEYISALSKNYLLLETSIIDINTGKEIIDIKDENSTSQRFQNWWIYPIGIWTQNKIVLFGRKNADGTNPSKDDTIMLYDFNKKDITWEHEEKGTGFTTPIAADNKLFIGTTDGRILAFGDPSELEKEGMWRNPAKIGIMVIASIIIIMGILVIRKYKKKT